MCALCCPALALGVPSVLGVTATSALVWPAVPRGWARKPRPALATVALPLHHWHAAGRAWEVQGRSGQRPGLDEGDGWVRAL